MNLTVAPLAVAKFNYSLARLPFTVFERKVVARVFSETAPPRLTFERVLGNLDGLAGQLLKDGELSRRGEALTRRADVLTTATKLEAKATQRRARADEQLTAERRRAEAERQRAETERQRAEDAERRVRELEAKRVPRDR